MTPSGRYLIILPSCNNCSKLSLATSWRPAYMLCPSLIPFICHISEVNPRSGCKTTPFLMSIVGAIYLPLRRNLLSNILGGGVRRWGGWTNSSVMMLMGPKHHKDDTFQFSSRSDIRNPVKNPPSSILELDP